MKIKVVYIGIVMLFFSATCWGQDNGQSVVIDQDLWYLWLDAIVEKEGKKVHVVSENLQEVYCCVSSRKYRKYLKHIVLELKKEYGYNIDLSQSFQKLNHPVLAQELMDKAKKRDNVIIVRWKASCH